MFSFPDSTKTRKNVKFKVHATLFVMHSIICICHPWPQGPQIDSIHVLRRLWLQLSRQFILFCSKIYMEYTYSLVHMMVVVWNGHLRFWNVVSDYFIVHHRKRCSTDIIRIRMLDIQFEVICHGRFWKKCLHLFFLSVSIPLHTYLLSSCYHKYVSPSLESVLALPSVSVQQNTAETVIVMPHIGLHRSGPNHIYLFLLWNKLENSGRYAVTGL